VKVSPIVIPIVPLPPVNSIPKLGISVGVAVVIVRGEELIFCEVLSTNDLSVPCAKSTSLKI
jgi:hypothetical protein